jgi:hypothetical protein
MPIGELHFDYVIMDGIVFALPLPGFAFQKRQYRKAFHHVTRFAGFPLWVWQGSGLFRFAISHHFACTARLHNDCTTPGKS